MNEIDFATQARLNFSFSLLVEGDLTWSTKHVHRLVSWNFWVISILKGKCKHFTLGDMTYNSVTRAPQLC